MSGDDLFEKKTCPFRLSADQSLGVTVHRTEERGIAIEVIETPRWLRNGCCIEPDQMRPETLGKPGGQLDSILNPRVRIDHHQQILVTHSPLPARPSDRVPI